MIHVPGEKFSDEIDVLAWLETLPKNESAFKAAVEAAVETLPKEQIDLILKCVLDLDAQKQINPKSNFRFNNPDQIEFLKLTNPFQFFCAGNKSGKTYTMAYKAALIAEGKLKAFKNKPKPGKPLINWLAGETAKVIEETPLKLLCEFFRPDQIEPVKKGSSLYAMRFWIDKQTETYSEFIIKSYEAGVDTFESSNLNGVIMADEEIPYDIFMALPMRVLAYGGWLLNALTPTHGLTYMEKVMERSDEFQYLTSADIGAVYGSTENNRQNIDDKLYQFAKRFYSGSPEAAAVRLEGKFASNTGKIYPEFRDFVTVEVNGQSFDMPWHVFNDKEMPDLDKCRIFAFCDYGLRDDFVFGLTAVDKDNTHWIFDCVYQPNMNHYTQCLAMRKLCDDWELRPLVTVADSQIRRKQGSGKKILTEWQEMVFTEDDPLYGYKKDEPIIGHEFTIWRAKEKDKKDKVTSRADLKQKLDINPSTGKPWYRFHERCSKMIKCLKRAEWKSSVSNQLEDIKGGDDHGESALRYYTRAGFTYSYWEGDDEIEARERVKDKYKPRNPWRYSGEGFRD